jgi:hypothetical protein
MSLAGAGGIGPDHAPRGVPPNGLVPGGGGTFRNLRRRQDEMMQPNMISSINPPIPAASPITRDLCWSTQDLISPPTEDPVHCPLLHLPLPLQGVPSRKFCCMLPHVSDGSLEDAHQSVQEESSQA